MHTCEPTTADTFAVDIQAFVQKQEQERKPFFSENDPELDALVGIVLHNFFFHWKCYIDCQDSIAVVLNFFTEASDPKLIYHIFTTSPFQYHRFLRAISTQPILENIILNSWNTQSVLQLELLL